MLHCNLFVIFIILALLDDVYSSSLNREKEHRKIEKKAKLKYTFDGHNGSVKHLIALSNEDLASGSEYDGRVKVWNLEQEKLRYSFDVSNGGFSGRIFSLTEWAGSCLVFGAFDNSIKVYDLAEGNLSFTLGGHANLIESLVELEVF